MQTQKTVSAQQRLERYTHIHSLEYADEIIEGKLKSKGLKIKENVALDCGWGRLVFGQTFAEHEAIIKELTREKSSCRDIAIYIRDHHVLLGLAPELLFLDPSHTYRLWLHMYKMPKRRSRAFSIRMPCDRQDAEEINRIYRSCGMLEAPPEKILENQLTRVFNYYLAERVSDNKVIGTISGIDHRLAFNDPDNGSSFWCLAVDTDARTDGVGCSLVC